MKAVAGIALSILTYVGAAFAVAPVLFGATATTGGFVLGATSAAVATFACVFRLIPPEGFGSDAGFCLAG